MVAQEMSATAAAEAQRKAELEAAPATTSRFIQKKDHQITITRVAPPALKNATLPDSADKEQSSPLTRAEFEARMTDQPEQQSISVSVMVFGDEYSKILWRKPRSAEERSDAPGEFEIWTNAPLKYLTPISSFERDDVVYNYFGFCETISREGELRRSALAKERGFAYESRWQESPVDFAPGQLEYVVTQPANRPVPPELYKQMDALFAHYLENEATLKTAYQRQQALNKAREAYRKENPPQPKDTVINFHPLSERSSATR
ncbi:MAG: hypothetical protein GVY36_02070 [Verrucomicrobia bacterium]|nr:hypothetical protein [Verrucomicrobiota bacterium]